MIIFQLFVEDRRTIPEECRSSWLAITALAFVPENLLQKVKRDMKKISPTEEFKFGEFL